MKTILLALIVLSSVLIANDSYDKLITAYLYNGWSKNSNLKELKVEIVDREVLQDNKEWVAYRMLVSAKELVHQKIENFSDQSLYFTNGTVVTPDLRNIITDERYIKSMAPKLKNEDYKDMFHLFGNKDAKHKVAIFSDPLCSYCMQYIPKVLDILKKSPTEYCVYYYHLPLGMHPAAKTLVKAYIVLEQQNSPKLNMNKLYDVKISAKEINEQKILNAFNKVFDTKVTVKDINTKNVLHHYEANLKISTDLMVSGTPSLFYDGKKDSIGRFLK